jgi:hypothetical protein
LICVKKEKLQDDRFGQLFVIPAASAELRGTVSGWQALPEYLEQGLIPPVLHLAVTTPTALI